MSELNLATVERLATMLSPEDQLLLVERIAERVRRHLRPKNVDSLYGIWKGKFPEDDDIDATLREIRSEWLSELDEFFGDDPAGDGGAKDPPKNEAKDEPKERG